MQAQELVWQRASGELTRSWEVSKWLFPKQCLLFGVLAWLLRIGSSRLAFGSTAVVSTCVPPHQMHTRTNLKTYQRFFMHSARPWGASGQRP